ncbi:unnamed protein product [Gemmataceae bacterium]|nr:unnamed protein product [Gemmataceae bacterium]VTU00565.1 unnamed protein product [Gemmataceae bacterium]
MIHFLLSQRLLVFTLCGSAVTAVAILAWSGEGRVAVGSVADVGAGKDLKPAPDPAAEYRRVGRLLRTLQPGMTRPQVEEILGPPRRVIEATFLDESYLHAEYRCLPPDLPPPNGGTSHLMHVSYVDQGPVPVFVRVGGPITNISIPFPDALDAPPAGAP